MNQLIERLSDLEHDQWAHWTEYMLDSLEPLLSLAIGEVPPSWETADHPVGLALLKLAGWRRQIATPYAELSEAEKDSDREWARKVLAVIGQPVELKLDSEQLSEIFHRAVRDGIGSAI